MRAGAEGMAGWEKAGAPKRAMRRCLILRQGAKPPETPRPLSVRIDFREPIGAVKGSQAVHSHALDSSDRFPTPSLYDGKGA